MNAFMTAVETAFGQDVSEADFTRFAKNIDPGRTVAAFDGDAIVGTTADYSLDMTIPGGSLPTAGVTVVGVLPTHRRRGILTGMMRRQFDAIHERGQPLAALWASESVIYQRYGFGLASHQLSIDAERSRIVFRDGHSAEGRWRLVPLEEAAPAISDVYDRVRGLRPGMYSRSAQWWATHVLLDPKEKRDGAGPLFCAVWESEGQVEAYALYRVHNEWGAAGTASRLTVHEAIGSSGEATKEIWRFLFGVDLIVRIQTSHSWLPLDHPLLQLLADTRNLRARMSDALWVRLVDVPAALEARGYAAAGRLTFELGDGFCSWNEGRWTLSSDGKAGTCTPSSDAAAMRIDVEDLAVAFMGGSSFTALAEAGRIGDVTPETLRAADDMFRTPYAPWCPEIF